jgi:site-specific recombinase XerD
MFLSKDSKSPFYQITYFVDGKRTKKSTKTSNKNEAKKFLDNFKIQLILDAQKINSSPVAKQNSILLSKYEEEYLKLVSLSKSKHYVRSVKLSFKHFQDFIGDIPLNKIELKQIDNFINFVYSRSESGASLYFRTLKAAFSKAVAWEYIPDNLFKKIKPPKTSKSLPLFINENELQLIIDNTPRQFLKDIFTIAFYSGLRISEILNMKWNWIDESQNLIITKISDDYKTKSKNERIIPIHSKISGILYMLKPAIVNPNSLIISHSTGRKYNEDFISKQFKLSLRAAKLNDDIHLHTLRHSFCSNLVQRGVSLYVVKELAGHQNITTTQIYSHLNKENLSVAISLL